CGTQKYDRFRRAPRDQRNDAPGFAQRIPNCRISRGARFDRSNCASKKIAAADCGIPALLCADSRVNYREALAWLYATQRFGIKLGLENIERLLVALAVVEGRALRDRSSGSAPDNAIVASQSSALPLVSQCTVIHVAGTNGKGSVCAMIDAVCRAAGYRAG